tara:strand:+ start:11145 stop:11264 length:120 start_codon:yes stop_codon:yes gene_type:complete
VRYRLEEYSRAVCGTESTSQRVDVVEGETAVVTVELQRK